MEDPSKPYQLSVKAVVLDSANRCLLLRRSPQAANFPARWDLPGGKVDPGEDFITALRRELREETGLAVALSRLIGTTEFEMPRARIVLLCLEAHSLGGPIHLSPEHVEFAWVEPSTLAACDLVDHVRTVLAGYQPRPVPFVRT